MSQVLRILRRLPVGVSKKIEDKVEDISVFINRELLPFLQELRESTAATFEQVTTNRLLGRDTPGTGDVEEISLDDTLEFTGLGSIQRAAISGDITIAAGSNDSAITAGVIVNADVNSDANIAVSKLEDGLALSVLGVAGNSSGQYEDIQASTARHVVRLNDAGTAVEFGYPLEFNVEGVDQGDVFGVDVVGGRGSIVSGVGEIDLLPQISTQIVTGTLNAHVLPVTLKHRDTLIFDPSANTTLNGIDLQDSLGVDWPEGFEFILHNSDAAFTVTVNDESGSAVADDRISTPRNQTLVLGQSSSLIFRRFVTRWGVIERGWPDGSTSIAYSGFELRRAALTGFAAASANSNATTSAEPIVTYSASANMSAERVLSNGTNTTVNVSVANQIAVDVPASNALIPDGDKGDITVSATGSTWTVDAGAISAAKLASDVTLAQVLSRGSTTGANNITFDANQRIILTGGSGFGDIQALGTFNLRSAGTVDIQASSGDCGLNSALGNLNLSGVNTLFTASTGFIQLSVLGVPRFYVTNTGALAIGAGADRGTIGELFISQGDTTPIWGQAVTASYTDASVTLPKIATQATDTLVANITAGSASPIAVAFLDIDSASIIWDAATHTFQRAALTGDVTASANSNATTIANDAVTTAKILNNNVTLAKIETLAPRTLISNNTLATATATEVPHTDLIIRPDLLDCFVGGLASTTLPMSSLGWLFRDIAGTGTVSRNGSSNTDGIYNIVTGNVANNASSFTLGDTATQPILTPTQFKYTEFKIDLGSLTSTRVQIGYMQNTDTATTGGTACCMFMFDTSVSANWITTTRAASTSTQKTSATAVTTVITKLGIATDFSGPTVRFYVNDSLIATHTSLENIPTTNMNVGIRLETLTGATRGCEISRFTAIRRLDGREIPEV